jgi:hypothetical protein
VETLDPGRFGRAVDQLSRRDLGAGLAGLLAFDEKCVRLATWIRQMDAQCARISELGRRLDEVTGGPEARARFKGMPW